MRTGQFKCAACGGPRKGISRGDDRTRRNALCDDCYAAIDICACGCDRSFSLYNGCGKKRKYFQGACYYNIPHIRKRSNQRRSRAMKAAWQRPEYRKAKSGKNHYKYIDGRTPYPANFNTQLRKQIKKRANYRCEDCGSAGLLYAHHIDHNPQNSDPNNLKAVCPKCHAGYHPKKSIPEPISL